jgi:hypothetical protein
MTIFSVASVKVFNVFEWNLRTELNAKILQGIKELWIEQLAT